MNFYKQISCQTIGPILTLMNYGEENDPFPYGFTGHFGDDESGLIYMGARYYNPTIAQFLTPDAVLPSPTDSLSYNRYSYTRNNPINLVDPSGNFFWAPIIGAIIGGLMAAVSGQNILMGMWIGAASGAFFGAAGGSFWGSVAAGFASGAMNSALYGGNILRGAIVGAISAGIGYGIGSLGRNLFPSLKGYGMGAVSAISGGVVGGLSSVMMGGSFSEGFKMGFISAGLSYAAAEVAAAVSYEGGVDNNVTPGTQPLLKSELGHGNPVADMPKASALPENQRTVDLYYGDDTSSKNKSIFVAVAKEKITAELLKKGYVINLIEVKSSSEFESSYAANAQYGHTTFIVAHHSASGVFYWHKGELMTDVKVAQLINKYSEVAMSMYASTGIQPIAVFYGCNTYTAAGFTSFYTGGMYWTWGAQGKVNPTNFTVTNKALIFSGFL